MNREISALANNDLQDVFKIISIATRRQALSEMRAKVVQSIKRAFRAQGVAFFLSDSKFSMIDNASLAGAGIDLNYLNKWVQYYCHDDPFQQELTSRTMVCKVDDILPYHRWVNLRIYNEFYRPQNIHYKLSIYLRSKDRVLGLIGLFRPREGPDFSRRDVAKARLLAPHLTTALENNLLLTQKEGERLISEEWRNKLPLIGVIILDEKLRPVHWNPEGKEISFVLCKQRPVANQGKPRCPPIPDEIYEDCLHLKELFQNGHPPASLRCQKIIGEGQDRKYQVISSIAEDSFYSISSLRFWVYLMDVSEICKDREETLIGKYRLTKREIDIIQSVCQGLTNDEIGERLYISRFTVETHLKNIFDKTGVKHRAGLASLV